MKRLIPAIGVSVALTATTAAQATKYGVTVKAEKNVDFAKFSTYAWTPGRPAFDKTVDAQIVEAVDRELGGLRMAKGTAESSDVLVSYSSLTRTDSDVNAKAHANGALPKNTIGVLSVTVSDPHSRRQLLLLRVDQPIDTEPAALEAAINDAVKAMFARYPARRAN
jgi:hypothetical protein